MPRQIVGQGIHEKGLAVSDLENHRRTPPDVAQEPASRGASLDHVLELTVDDDAVVARLLKRAASEGRADDTEDVIRERMAIYHRETRPLADTYNDRGLLVRVDGLGSVDEVTARILAALG